MKFNPTAILLSVLVVGCSSEGHNATEHEGTAGAPGAGTSAGAFSSIPNPAILVANGEGTVSIVSPDTLAVVSSVRVMEGMHPHHISISRDKSRVLITATSADLSLGHDAGAHSGHGGASATTIVYLLDVASRELRSVITVAATAHNAAFSADQTTIALGMMEQGMLAVHSAVSFEQSFTATGFAMPLEVTPTANGSLLVAESGASSVAVFDPVARTTTARFEVGAVPVAAWAAGGSDYFVAAEAGMQLNHLVEDASGVNPDTHAIELEGMPGQAALTPNGAELWVAIEDRGLVAILDAKSHALTAEVAAGTKPHGIAFEPSGSRAFVTDEGGGKLLVVDTTTRMVTSEVSLGGKPNGIAWLAK